VGHDGEAVGAGLDRDDGLDRTVQSVPVPLGTLAGGIPKPVQLVVDRRPVHVEHRSADCDPSHFHEASSLVEPCVAELVTVALGLNGQRDAG